MAADAEDLPLVGKSQLTPVTGNNWWQKDFKPDEIAESMLYADCKGKTATGEHIPAEWGGLWWMDGNPAPETVASFGRAHWYPGAKGCRKTEMDQAFNKAAKFSMVKVNSDYWMRYSLDGIYPYHLKRIIGCNGRPVQPHWKQFLSNGKERPQVIEDVYGHGGDKRTHVAKVSQDLFVRWNSHPKPEGSGWTCAKDTGGRCHVLGCDHWRKATCDEHRRCMCPKNHCRGAAGKCVSKLHKH